MIRVASFHFSVHLDEAEEARVPRFVGISENKSGVNIADVKVSDGCYRDERRLLSRWASDAIYDECEMLNKERRLLSRWASDAIYDE